MSVTRFGGVLQAAGARNVSFFAEASSTLIAKAQVFLEQAAEATSAAFEKQSANLLIILLTPASMLALVFALWRISADLGWTGEFVISGGFFSHWQVWMALAIGLKFAASSLQVRVRASAKTSEEN